MVADLRADPVEEQDPPGPARSGDAVRDHDERAATAGERRLCLLFRGGIEMAGGNRVGAICVAAKSGWL